MSHVELFNVPPEILCVIGGFLNHRDLSSFRISCSWFYGVLYHNFKQSGPKGRCIICSKQIRCTKHSQKKFAMIQSLMKTSSKNLIDDNWNVVIYTDSIHSTRIVVNKRWRIVYPCGCRVHPRCKQTWDDFATHVAGCQKFVRYCSRCGRTNKECGHPIIGKIRVFRYKY